MPQHLDLKQRRVNHVTAGLQLLNEPFQRHLAVLGGFMPALLDVLQQGGKAGIAFQIGAEHPGVFKGTDASLVRRPAVGDRTTDGDVLLSGVAPQQNLEGGQQQNRFSAVKCLCLLVSRARQGGRHAAAAARPLQTGGFDGGTRKIGGQTQDRDLLKLLFPILLGALSGWGAQPLLLPHRKSTEGVLIDQGG